MNDLTINCEVWTWIKDSDFRVVLKLEKNGWRAIVTKRRHDVQDPVRDRTEAMPEHINEAIGRISLWAVKHNFKILGSDQ